MDALLVLGIQCTFSFILFFLIARWYIDPLLSLQNRDKYLVILLIINVFRYLPLSLYLPGQVSDDFPILVKDIIAHGDFLAALLAFVALLMVKYKFRFSRQFVWLFSMVSIVDIVLALTFAMKAKVYQLPLGFNYFVVAVYVPMLMVLQIQIIKILINKW